MKPKPKVAIIGAGLAGLTAALRLYQKNYDVTVYEARGRVGGHVLTILVKNSDGTESIAEVGGQNITDGGNAGYLLSLAEELKLNVIAKKVVFESLVAWDGKYLAFKDLVSQMGLNSLEMEAYIDSFAKTSASIGELIEKIFCHHPALKMALRTRLAGYEGVPVDRQSIYHNIDTLKISLKGALSMAHAQVDDKPYYLTLKTIEGGNAKLPLKMAERLGERVQLHKALRRVHDNNGQIKLEFKDGTIAFYDKLILAVPPSVYGDIKFDDSILPQESVEVFSKVGYGKNYKVLVPMPICSDGTYRCIITKHQVSFFNADGRILVMYCHQPLPSVSKEMETILKGQGVSEPILSEPQTIKDQHFEVYEKPSIYLWENDPYAKGAYSGYSTDLSAELDKLIDYRGIPVKEVFKPLNDRIYFIGEHTTILEAIGTMEAAVESGERISKLFHKLYTSLT